MPTVDGLPACSCQVKWCPEYKAELKRRGIVIRFVQLIGLGAKSGNTHAGGGADDCYLVSWPKTMTKDEAWKIVVSVGRQMGSDARWRRRYNWDGRGGEEHCHGVLTGCPHNGPARYQIDAVRRGRNGLANNGPDDGPRPLSGRTWQDGIKWAKAQAKTAAAAEKKAKAIEPWFNTVFLNIAGNNATLAATTIKRAGSFLDDVTAGNPAVVGLAEIRSDQIADITSAMKTRGYKKAAHSHMVAVFVREAVIVRGSSFAKYKRQGKGSVEGMLRVKLTIDGSKCQVGVTHLDYPAKSTSVRVAQMKEGIASLRRYGITSLLPDWKSRTVILADINDSTGAVVKAARAAGFVDAGAGAAIDKIFVGSRRKMRGASKHATTSDHPIVKAKLGKS